MTDPLPKACVILGAGASHDVRNEGSPVINGVFRPPLARHLFDIENHHEYVEFLEIYPGAAFLAQELAPSLSSGEQGLEDALRAFADHRSEQVREHFRFIPPYLRDLIHATTIRYTHWPSNNIQLVLGLLEAENPHEVLFLVLNYDDFLEKALTMFDSNIFRFIDIQDYIASSRPAKVVKLHGSINWFRHLRPAGGLQWDQIVRGFDDFVRTTEHNIVVQHGVDKVKDYSDSGRLLYPILTAPLAGKDINDMVCPESHIEFTRDFLSTCNKFLIIGTSGLDDDLLTLLHTSLDPKSLNYVQVVGRDWKDASQTLGRFQKGVAGFEGSIPGRELRSLFDKGFKDYVSSDELRAFAEVVI